MLFRAWLPALGLLVGFAAETWAGIEFFDFNNGNLPIEIVDATATDISPANPYPSTVTVSGIPAGQILNVQVLLNGFTHTFPDDTAAVVVSPSGSATLLFNGPGLGFVSDLDWVFDDNAANALSDDGTLTSGTFRPGQDNYPNQVPFPAPGPGLNFDFDFSAWLNENPEGEWRLFVVDAFNVNSGTIARGWGLRFEVDVVPEPTSFGLGLLGMSALMLVRRRP